VSSLGEQFPVEQARCRELLGQYREIGPAGMFGAAIIEDVLQRADQAAISGDVIAMIQVFGEMQELK
jgi:hypothetical protein